MKIKVDNKACIAIAEDENAKDRCKHIDTSYKFIQEKIKEKNIKLEYISTNDMLADPLTKPVSGINIKKFNDIIFDN